MGSALGRGAAMLLGGQWTKALLQFASLMLLSRLLAPSQFGLVAMVTAVIGVANVFGDFGLSLAAIQAEHLSQGQKSNLFWLNSCLGGAIGLVVFLCAPLLGQFYEMPAVEAVCRWLACTFPLNGLSVQFKAQLNRDRRYGGIALIDTLGVFLGLVVALLAAAKDFGYWAIVAQQLTVAFVPLILSVVLCGWRPSLPARGAPMKDLLKFGVFTLLAQMVTYLSSNVDTIVMGRMWGDRFSGLYSRAFQLSSMPAQQISSPLTRVVLPKLSELDRVSSVQFVAFVRRCQVLLLMSVGLVLSLLFALASAVVPVLLGAGWTESVPLLKVLCLNALLMVASYVTYWIALAKARMKDLFVVELCARGVMIGAIVVGGQFSPMGVAIGASVGGFLMLVLTMAWFLPRVGLSVSTLSGVTARLLSVAMLSGVLGAAACDFGLSQGGVTTGLAVGVLGWLLITFLLIMIVPSMKENAKVVFGVLKVTILGFR